MKLPRVADWARRHTSVQRNRRPLSVYWAELLPLKVSDPTIIALETETAAVPPLPFGLPKVALSGRVESNVRPVAVPELLVHTLPVLLHVPLPSTSPAVRWPTRTSSAAAADRSELQQQIVQTALDGPLKGECAHSPSSCR